MPETPPPLARALLVAGLALLVLASFQALPGSTLHASAAPLSIVLQPDAANGTDTSIVSLSPSWNFGNNASLAVGPNATTGNLARSLLSFNLAALPPNAALVNATLSLYETQGSGGIVQVRQLTSPWTEGSGGHSWTSLPVTVRETAGVNRTLEPVVVTIPFAPNSIATATRDLRVYSGGIEVPSQVYNERISGGQIVSADVAFDATVGAYQSRTFTVVYSTNGTSVPAYRQQTWGTSPLWTSNATGGGASGVAIADLTGDGRLEIVFGGTDGFVYCLDARGHLIWRTQVSATQSIPYTPQVADMDRSGKDSIIAVTNDPSVVRLDSTGKILWRFNSTNIFYTSGTLVDVNGDGVLDVLMGGNMKQVIALDGRTGSLIQQYPVGGAGYTPTIAALSPGAAPLIAFDGYDRLVHLYPLSGPELWAAAPTGTSVLENSVGFGDLDGNGVYEFVTGDFANNGNVFALYASNGTVAWNSNAGKGFAGGLTLGDLNHDGKLETLLGDVTGGMYAFSSTGGLLWSYSAGSVEPGTPAAVDLTNSGFPQLVYIEGTSVVVLDHTGALRHTWTISANNLNTRSGQLPYTGPAIADLTGNGTLEVVVPTGTGIEAFAAPGLAHDWRAWGYNQNHTQRALDGTSGTGAPFLAATLGAPQVHPATGASWNYEDGVKAWNSPGGDFGGPVASAAGTPGWMAWNVTSLVQGWVLGTYPNDGLILAEASEVTGSLHAFTSSDGPVAGQRPMLTITYYSIAGNAPPSIVGRIPDLTLLENAPPQTVDLTGYANLSATPLSQLRWNVTGYNRSEIEITGLNVLGNARLTIYPQPNGWGSNRVTYWLSDPQGRVATQQAWINVTHVNQPPTFVPPGVLYVHYNQTYRFDFGPYISDIDTPRSQLLLTTDDPVHTSVAGFNVSFTYPFSLLNDWVFVNLTVSDGQLSVAKVVAIQVTADSPPAVLTPLPDVTLNEGQTRRDVFNLDNYFTDPDGGLLFFSAGNAHVNVTIEANHSVDIAAPAGWWGQDQVTFRAKDPTGAIAEDTITVTVLHVDQPPSIGPVPNLVVRFDLPYSFDVDPYLSDPDTPTSQLILTASDPYAYVSGHLLTFLYPASLNNTVRSVILTVSDGAGSASRTILVTIGADTPPVLSRKMPDASFLEGTVARGVYTLSQYFTDPDGTVLYWTSGNRSVRVTIHANSSVDLSAVPYWHGTERVTFRATDPAGALQEDSVWITVLPVDHAPYFKPVPRQVLNTTTTYLLLAPYMADPDSNVSTLTLVDTNSSHAIVLGQGILLTYYEDTTEYVRVVLSDGNLTNSTIIVVSVQLPAPTRTVSEIVPTWLYWLPVPLLAAGLAGFVVYRRRQLEWAFLVTNDGLLVSSVSRRGPVEIDTDLVSGMLTAIMDFAKTSFSDEKERNLEGLEMGDKRVALVRGSHAFLAVVYRGRTPGRLLALMRSLVEKIEREHGDAIGEIVDTAKLGDVPLLLERLLTRGNLPFVWYRGAQAPPA